MRVADEFKVFTNVWNVVVDPKNFDPRSFVDIRADFCDVPPNSFALARSVEKFKIPRNILSIVLGKSTFARCGIIVNVTPLEPCFADDTEILTTTGWTMIKDVQIGDQVLAMRADGLAEWQSILRKQAYQYNGNLIHFKGRSIDMLVTPDHKVVVRRRTNPKSEEREFTPWHTTEASNVYGRHNFEMTREVRWQGRDITEEIQINEQVFPTNPFLEFLGAYLGDGWSYKNKGGYTIHLAAFKERAIEYFAAVLERLGVRFSRTDKGYMFFSKTIFEFVHPLGHAEEKHIPVQIKELPPERLHYLLLGLMNSDGNDQTETYTTVSRRLADDVQEIIFKCGFAATVRQAKPELKERELNGWVIKNNHPVYKIRLSRTHLTPKINPERHELVAYNGFVYDITVPSPVIFVRRNGKAVWSGNCWEGYVTIEISNTTPLPARIYANEGIGQVLFLESDEECETSYADKQGKYQSQEGIVLPRVEREQ